MAQQKITTILRDKAGALRVLAADKGMAIGDDHAELDAHVEKQKKAGARMVLVLWSDNDSVARHWVKPKE